MLEVMYGIRNIDELVLDLECISLYKAGKELVDLYNECSLETTDYHNDELKLTFLKVADSGQLKLHDVIELVFTESSINTIKLDNILEDWTAMSSIKRLGNSDNQIYEIVVGELIIEVTAQSLTVNIRKSTDEEISIHKTKESYKIPIGKRSKEQKQMMSASHSINKIRNYWE
jgi:hypothetical protein